MKKLLFVFLLLSGCFSPSVKEKNDELGKLSDELNKQLILLNIAYDIQKITQECAEKLYSEDSLETQHARAMYTLLLDGLKKNKLDNKKNIAKIESYVINNEYRSCSFIKIVELIKNK